MYSTVRRNINTSRILALHAASIGNNLPEIERLLFLGADVNVRDENRKTALHQATRCNTGDSHLLTIKLLLEYGAEVNVHDGDGKTPLHYLSTSSSYEVVKLILDYGADVNIIDYGRNVPMYGAINNLDTRVLQLLLERGSRISSNGGLEPLHWAFLSNKPRSIKCLVRHGAKLDEYLGVLTGIALRSYFEYEKTWLFLIEYTNIPEILLEGQFEKDLVIKLWTLLLQHTAKLQALGVPVNQKVLETILKRDDYRDYFEGCRKELELANSTKVEDSWVTYFNLLVDSKRKLKNYAGNRNLVRWVQKSDCTSKFPIYGASMEKNLEKGLKRRKAFDESAGVLSNILPIFGPNHLIVRNTLDCLTSKDYAKLALEKWLV